jgi:hypothetical protein
MVLRGAVVRSAGFNILISEVLMGSAKWVAGLSLKPARRVELHVEEFRVIGLENIGKNLGRFGLRPVEFLASEGKNQGIGIDDPDIETLWGIFAWRRYFRRRFSLSKS